MPRKSEHSMPTEFLIFAMPRMRMLVSWSDPQGKPVSPKSQRTPGRGGHGTGVVWTRSRARLIPGRACDSALRHFPEGGSLGQEGCA